jgi:hypothetical protein
LADRRSPRRRDDLPAHDAEEDTPVADPQDVLLTDPSAPTSPDASPRMSTRDRTVIAVLLVSTFVVILNETIMSVALPVLLTDLAVEASVGQWLTAGFLLTMRWSSRSRASSSGASAPGGSTAPR